MSENRKITKAMVDYVNQHKNEGTIRYDKAFYLVEGEGCVVEGVSEAHDLFRIRLNDGGGCWLPVAFFDINPVEYAKRLNAIREREEFNKNTDWASVRVKAAIAFGHAMISGLSYRPPHGIVAKDAVRYADELIEELKQP